MSDLLGNASRQSFRQDSAYVAQQRIEGLANPNPNNTTDAQLPRIQDSQALEAQVRSRMRSHTIESLSKLLVNGSDSRDQQSTDMISLLDSPPSLIHVETHNSVETDVDDQITTVKVSFFPSNTTGVDTRALSLALPKLTMPKRLETDVTEFISQVTERCIDIARADSPDGGLSALNAEFQAQVVERLALACGTSRIVNALHKMYPELEKAITEREKSASNQQAEFQIIEKQLRALIPPVTLSDSLASSVPKLGGSVASVDLGGGGPVDHPGAIIVILGLWAAALAVEIGVRASIFTIGAIHTVVFGWRYTVADRHYSKWSTQILDAVKSSERHGLDSDTAGKIMKALRDCIGSDWMNMKRVTRPTAAQLVQATIYALQRLDRESVEPFLDHIRSKHGVKGKSESIADVAKRAKAFFHTKRPPAER